MMKEPEGKIGDWEWRLSDWICDTNSYSACGLFGERSRGTKLTNWVSEWIFFGPTENERC